MFGLGKKRSEFGKFLDNHGIKQEAVCKETGLNRETLTKACSEENPKMRMITKKALASAAKKLSGENVTIKDFWS
ncbi:transcriptional regulator [Paenibacillus sp. FSL R5-0407]|uniref:transcriptional regulator n=1 Tax=Paenibacillus sp. FSL R5-0407 TaxID=2975320 RepID=UPI0030FA60F2